MPVTEHPWVPDAEYPGGMSIQSSRADRWYAQQVTLADPPSAHGTWT